MSAHHAPTHRYRPWSTLDSSSLDTQAAHFERNRHLRLTTCDSAPTPTHSRAHPEREPLILPSTGGCRAPRAEDEPRGVGSPQPHSISTSQRRRSRAALLAAAAACSNFSAALACQVDYQAHCRQPGLRSTKLGREERAADLILASPRGRR